VSVKRSAGALQRLVSDLFSMARAEKKWWLLPMVLLVLVIAGLMAAAALTGPLAPFLYPLL
jgi:hypothetical protein